MAATVKVAARGTVPVPVTGAATVLPAAGASAPSGSGGVTRPSLRLGRFPWAWLMRARPAALERPLLGSGPSPAIRPAASAVLGARLGWCVGPLAHLGPRALDPGRWQEAQPPAPESLQPPLSPWQGMRPAPLGRRPRALHQPQPAVGRAPQTSRPAQRSRFLQDSRSRASGVAAPPVLTDGWRSPVARRRWILLPLLLLPLAAVTGVPRARAADTDQLIRLLQQGSCPGCRLQDADLVQASLRDADLSRAQLQRANLSGAQLDGARLMGADLSFTTLAGASLRGADLRGSRLEGTDLRGSDLSGAQLDPGALSRAHWQDARGIRPGSLGYAEVHNAGVRASLAGNPPQAEALFSEAIVLRPEAAVTWLARAISRNDQGKTELAAADFRYAGVLYGQQGDSDTARRLEEAAASLDNPARPGRGSRGQGVNIMAAAAGLFQSLAPLAIRFLPMGL